MLDVVGSAADAGLLLLLLATRTSLAADPLAVLPHACHSKAGLVSRDADDDDDDVDEANEGREAESAVDLPAAAFSRTSCC